MHWIVCCTRIFSTAYPSFKTFGIQYEKDFPFFFIFIFPFFIYLSFKIKNDQASHSYHRLLKGWYWYSKHTWSLFLKRNWNLVSLGYALAKTFAQQGNHVIATTRNIDALEGLEGTLLTVTRSLIQSWPTFLCLAYGCEKEALDINSQESINAVTQVLYSSFFFSCINDSYFLIENYW